MSLLNQVLRDLDERSPPGQPPPMRLAVTPEMAGAAEDLDEPAGGRSRRYLIWVMLGVAALVAVWISIGERRLSVAVQGQPLPPGSLSTPMVAEKALTTDPEPVGSTPTPDPMKPIEASATVVSPAVSAGDEDPTPEEGSASSEPRSQAVEHDISGPSEPQADADAGYRPLRNTEIPPSRVAEPAARRQAPAARVEVKTALAVPEDALQAARRAIEDGELAEAEMLLRRRLDRAPGDLEARELLLGMMLRGDRADAAMQQLRAGMRHHPRHDKFILIKARLLAQDGDLESAVDLLQGAGRNPGSRAAVLQMLGSLYQQLARYEAAVESYRGLLAITPASGPSWVGLALGLDGLGDRQAAEAYRRALRLGGLPQAAEAYARRRLGEMER